MAMKCKTCDCNNAEVPDTDAQELKGSLIKTMCRPCRRKGIERDIARVTERRRLRRAESG